MKKLKKNALKGGVSGNNYYICPSCGKQNALSAKYCAFCNTKKPTDIEAQEIATMPKQDSYGFRDRTVINAYPAPAQPYYAQPLQQSANPQGNLPDYYATDEYGRVFKAKVSYGALPCSGPVPIPTPTKIVQVAPINIPLNTSNNTNY